MFTTCLTLSLIAGVSAFHTAGRLPSRNGVMSLRASSKEELVAAQKDLFDLVEKQNCNPILIRLAWHDAGTYDDKIGAAAFPKCGGANGSIRFDPELAHGANAGLKIALNLLGSIKKKHENVGWADLMQMASAVAVEHAGGPKIPMKYGRVDAVSAEECSPEGNLPNAAAPFGDGTNTPQDHLRKVFYRMGLSDKDIVALSGAHTLGRAWKNRSGFGAENGTKFTTGDVTPRADGKPGYGTKGGTSWTQKWLAFDNSYFTELMLKDSDPELLKLDTDKILLGDESFRPLCETYAKDSAAFFADYAVSHAKLSELGVKWSPEGGITL